MQFNETMEQNPRAKLLRPVWGSKFFRRDVPAAIIYDLDAIQHQVNQLKQVFPTAFHALSVKANPLPSILKPLNQAQVGLEAASIGEVYLAMKSGYEANQVVFDSPAKSVEDLEFALAAGVVINADNLLELERIDALYKELGSKSRIGLRINPQIGMGSIVSSSVAGKVSKFGVPLSERESIITAFQKYKWLKGLHVHSGSQGMAIKQLVAGVKAVYSLVEDIHSVLVEQKRTLDFFDIGGGFPVSYLPEQQAPQLEQYASALAQACPLLFDGSIQLMTEFGRFVFANAGVAVSRVEYVKESGGEHVLIAHLGADFMLRTAYLPQDWPHTFSVLDKKGNPKSGVEQAYSIAGPLCFGGDFIGRSVSLPKVEAGDLLLIHDIGAYTLSMWSRYNSRRMPVVLGISNGKVQVLKKRENLTDILKFWT